MKWAELKKRSKVYDRWYAHFGPGFVVSKTKSKVVILFENMTIWSYDKGHVQFLESYDAKQKARTRTK